MTDMMKVYQMHPDGGMVPMKVDPEQCSVLDDIEEMEIMLNQGYMVHIDQEVLEREWAKDV